MKTIILFIKNNLKTIALLLVAPVLYFLYYLMSVKSIYQSQFIKDYNEQINEHGRITAFTSGQVWEYSEKIAVFLGTHKVGGRNSEDEQAVINILLRANPLNDDFFFLAGTYKAYHTDGRNLINDLIDLLSNSEYDSIFHILQKSEKEDCKGYNTAFTDIVNQFADNSGFTGEGPLWLPPPPVEDDEYYNPEQVAK